MELAIKQALETWYIEGHPLRNDPLHPALGLAGEAGELLDLYKKERFKTGYSWWDCVLCGNVAERHDYEGYCLGGIASIKYTPKILDELGDLWFYLRILAYQSSTSLEVTETEVVKEDKLIHLVNLNFNASVLLLSVEEADYISESRLQTVFNWFRGLLISLDFTLDQVTESNWQKLKDGDNHGWKTARDTVP